MVSASSTVSSGDTCGLSGPTFLAIYACLLGAAGLAALARRRWVRRCAGDASLHPVELAYLVGGPDHATIVAFVGLCRQGAVRVPEGSPAAPGPVDPSGADPRLVAPDELLDLTEGHRPVVVGRAHGHPLEVELATQLDRSPAGPSCWPPCERRPRWRRCASGWSPSACWRTRSWPAPCGPAACCLALVVPRHPPAARALVARVREDERRSSLAEDRANELRKRGTFEVRGVAEDTPDPMAVAALGPAVAWATAPVLLASAGFAPPDFTLGTEFARGPGSAWTAGGGCGGGGCGG